MLPVLTKNSIGIISNFEFGILCIMRRNRSYIPDLQKNRIKIREKKGNSVGHAYLQFLGSGADGAAKSVYLFTDLNRYIFNVGEGTQRIAHEHKIKIARLEHVFITTPIWENIGGLPGLALTIQECGVPDLTLHGPTGVDCIFDATKSFVVLNDLNITRAICEKDKLFEDDAITIKYVPLKSNIEIKYSNTSNATNVINGLENINEIDYYPYMRINKNRNDTLLKSSNSRSADLTFPSSLRSMAYICRLTPKKGALNLEKCVEKGVPPGPLLGKLKNDENIYLSDGTEVKADDVKYPDSPGVVFIIVECPTLDFIDSLLNEKEFKKHQNEISDESDIPLCVIHFTPSSIVDDKRYQTWMKKFPEKTLQINVNDKNKCLGCVGCHEMQYKLNLLDEKIFPLLKDDSIPIISCTSTVSEDIFAQVKRRILDEDSRNSFYGLRRIDLNFSDDIVNTLRILSLRPLERIQNNILDYVCINPDDVINEVTKMDGFKEELRKLKLQLHNVSKKIENIPNALQYPIITFLGTGSCIPNKCRNTSSILVTLESNNHMLMDCGEGTYGQLMRHFGADRVEKILANLNIIFISHLHADHHIGLINLLKHRRKVIGNLNVKCNKVFLLAPITMMFWLSKYQEQFEEILDCIDFIPNQDLEYRKKSKQESYKLYEVAPLKEITTSYVIHCPHAFGITFTHSNGNKITYSGDTMPSKDLLAIGRGSQLLIHEATFEDDLKHEAKSKLHSTTSEAIEMGCKMEAEHIILTHFSQRYSKIPFINDISSKNVGIAFDNMEITMNDLLKLPLFYPVFKVMFSEEYEDLKSKNIKRKRMTLSSAI